MIVVYEAATELEAQMVLNMLNQANIPGELIGTHLPGAVGELPAVNLVKVRVNPRDVEEAKSIIRDWESSQTFNPPQKPAGRSSAIFPFSLGALLAGGSVLWFTHSPVSTEGADVNRDGQQDEFYTWQGDRLAEFKSDRNFDGQIDSIVDYRNGVPASEKLDDDFDGMFETTVEYHHGGPLLAKTDLNGDAQPDYVRRFVHSVPVEADFIDGSIVVKRQRFSATGQLLEAFIDEDADGDFDIVIRYDDLEDEIERAPYESFRR